MVSCATGPEAGERIGPGRQSEAYRWRNSVRPGASQVARARAASDGGTLEVAAGGWLHMLTGCNASPLWQRHPPSILPSGTAAPSHAVCGAKRRSCRNKPLEDPQPLFPIPGPFTDTSTCPKRPWGAGRALASVLPIGRGNERGLFTGAPRGGGKFGTSGQEPLRAQRLLLHSMLRRGAA